MIRSLNSFHFFKVLILFNQGFVVVYWLCVFRVLCSQWFTCISFPDSFIQSLEKLSVHCKVSRGLNEWEVDSRVYGIPYIALIRSRQNIVCVGSELNGKNTLHTFGMINIERSSFPYVKYPDSSVVTTGTKFVTSRTKINRHSNSKNLKLCYHLFTPQRRDLCEYL